MYISKEFKEAWEEWKEHKKEKYGLPYTSISERKALSKLFQLSHGIEKLAIDSIEYSIEHNWSSVFIKPKELNNGTNKTSNGGSFTKGGQLASTAIIPTNKTFNTSL